ncbi:hypothetical protein [Halobacillus kuroshimensis]|uniref:hypothetical protein n=1 Tax=Halobacillus kuroshimensis TaxID=302481 RepID=UPI000419B5DD|nr:hypothetical protein [Halobacillus kuroshimensis]
MTERQTMDAIELMVLFEEIDMEYENKFVEYCFLKLVERCVDDLKMLRNPFLVASELKNANADFLIPHFKRFDLRKAQNVHWVMKYL